MELTPFATSSKSERSYWLLAFGGLALIYFARIGGSETFPAFGGATSTYIVSAQSLANHTGYRLVNYPDAPLSLKFPIGYPFLLSLIFRLIPFGTSSVIAARFLNVCAALVWVEASRRLLRRTVSPVLAAGAALAAGLAPLTLDLSGQILSDMVFAAICITTILLALPDVNRDTKHNALVRGALIGMLAAAAMLVRTIGFTLVFGLAVEMLLRRRWWKLGGFIIAAGLCLGPWLIWSSLHEGGTFNSYASQNVLTWRTPVNNFWLLASQIGPGLAFSPFNTHLFAAMGSRLHLNVLPILLGFAIVALVVVGWAILLYRRQTIALVLGPYMAVVLMWWWEPSRFIVPVIPLFIYCAVEGGKAIFAGRAMAARKVVYAAVVGCLASSLAVDAFKIHNVWSCGNWSGPDEAGDWAQMQQGMNWIRQTTPQIADVYCTFPEGVYLFTARRTLELNRVTNLDAELSAADPAQPIYFYTTLRRGFIDADNEANAPLSRFIAGHPGQFELLWTSENGLARIYKFVNEPTLPASADANSNM
jgi:hypothetical protein